MKYPIRTAHGDAGEFFFAYQIASVLKWPCRLFDIDIGIDAQVEIISEDSTSTGRFVAFQVKATSIEEQDCRYVSKRQLAYWRELDLPVFVVLVDLSIPAMFLHRVELDREYATTKKGLIRIDFDLENERFTSQSGRTIAAAAEETALSHVRRYLDAVHEGAGRIRTLIAGQQIGDSDPHGLMGCMDERAGLREELAQAGALVAALRVGALEYANAESEFESALQELRDYMEVSNMYPDWDDDGDILRFIKEGR